MMKKLMLIGAMVLALGITASAAFGGGQGPMGEDCTMEEKLEAMVEAGEITQEQADEWLAKMLEGMETGAMKGEQGQRTAPVDEEGNELERPERTAPVDEEGNELERPERTAPVDEDGNPIEQPMMGQGHGQMMGQGHGQMMGQGMHH